MDPFAEYLQNLEAALNLRLGLDPSRSLAEGTQVHQFVFSPTFHPSSTLVLDCSASETVAFLAIYQDLGHSSEIGCWQDLQQVDPLLAQRFQTAAGAVKPWTLSDVNTHSRDGILLGYRFQTAARAARFYAFNPDRQEHARHLDWLERGLRMAVKVFPAAEAQRHLERVRQYLTP